MNRVYCCSGMQEEGWFIDKVNNERFDLDEEYSAHFLKDVKYCPWCSTLLSVAVGSEVKHERKS